MTDRPDVTLQPIAADRRPVLARLMQLYIHDFSEFDGEDVNADGLYAYRWVEDDTYWREPDRHPFFILVDGQLAGFALVSGHSVRDTPDVRCIAEFFVMHKYRRRGVGRIAARAVFAALPGRWEVAVAHDNPPARAFWRSVIADITGGAFTEEFVNNAVWEGPVWSFTAPPGPDRT